MDLLMTTTIAGSECWFTVVLVTAALGGPCSRYFYRVGIPFTNFLLSLCLSPSPVRLTHVLLFLINPSIDIQFTFLVYSLLILFQSG